MFNPGLSILTGMHVRKYNNYLAVSKKLGYHENTVSGWVSGRQGLSINALKDLATLFEVPLSIFIRWGEADTDINLLKQEVLRWQR